MKTPCQLDPEKWVSDNADEREEAEHACGPCPLIIQCYDLAVDNDEQWGVWGGVDRSPGSQRHKRRRECVVCGKLMPRLNGHPRSSCVGCVEKKPCLHCGNKFARTYQSARQWAGARYCSQRCSGRASNPGRAA